MTVQLSPEPETEPDTDEAQDEDAPQDVTHQSLSIARQVDRLPPGEYSVRIIKGTRSSAWRSIFWDDTGLTINDLTSSPPWRK